MDSFVGRMSSKESEPFECYSIKLSRFEIKILSFSLKLEPCDCDKFLFELFNVDTKLLYTNNTESCFKITSILGIFIIIKN